MLGSKYRLGFAVLAMTSAFVGMAALAPARADIIDYTLTIPNSSVTGTGPYGTVEVDRLSSTEALITFTSNAAGGYYFLDGGSAGVNASLAATISNIQGNQTGDVGNCTGDGCYSDGGSKNEDGFGLFSNTVNTADGFSDRSSSISFYLTTSSGTWASASAVLTDNLSDQLAAAHIGTCDPTNCTSFISTGYAADGRSRTDPVPEPASLVIFGTALLALGGLSLLRRRRGEYEA